MSFDKPTRNALAGMVGECRRLLTEDIRLQLQTVYGLQPDGTALPVARLTFLDEGGRESARALRDWQEHLAATEGGSETERKKAAFDRLARETAFTVLNRLAALRMCEERGHVIECVRRGMESDGFALYERFSGGVLGSRGEAYRIFLERMFDELAVDLGALFDRQAPQSLVFPRERCLEDVLAQLNRPELAHLWKEDETIGWVYQYFNSKEEREKMREESAAPRNSRELAVRNQFFTPRYVVEFLVDNTLGHIWYEMRKGETALKDSCRYLVRRPTEVFLKPGEEPPPSAQRQDNLSQEELLRQSAYIPYRPKKDPRDLKILDPACGSGHFLLYAFDLLETIYEEVWNDAKQSASEATGKTLREDYPNLNALRIELAGLILRHNLHGIDIDLRASQIAALALWLRAQRSYQRLGLKGADRPKITKSNIVCAEPMPGERALLDQFVAGLEPKVIGQLVQIVFEKMKLAGEAGSLLKIEEEIASAVVEAKRQWVAGPKAEQGRLFGDDARPKQGELGLDFSGITDESFWQKTEERIYATLQSYAEQAENGHGYRWRLFADDAARGFAFIDLSRRHYDVVLMNPPFGQFSNQWTRQARAAYPLSSNDILAAFVDRFVGRLLAQGLVGAITSRTCFYLLSFQEWREQIVLRSALPRAMADLGHGVMDSAMVEAAAYTLHKCEGNTPLVCIRLLTEPEKQNGLLMAMEAIRSGGMKNNVFSVMPTEFQKVPGSPFCYWVGSQVRDLFVNLPPFDSDGREAKQGLATGEDFRFVRAWWEVPPSTLLCLEAGSSQQAYRRATHGRVSWCPFAKGGVFSPFYQDLTLVVRWTDDGYEIRNFADPATGYVFSRYRGAERYFDPGFTYADRASARFCPRVLPEGAVISVKGSGIYTARASAAWDVLAILNSLIFTRLMDLLLGRVELAKSYQVNTVGRVPWPSISVTSEQQLGLAAREGWRLTFRLDRSEPTSHAFVLPAIMDVHLDSLATAQLRCAALVRDIKGRLAEVQQSIDKEALTGYGLSEADSAAIEEASTGPTAVTGDANDEDTIIGGDATGFLIHLIDYACGVVFGRWDIRFATGEKKSPELPDPFGPLPVCPPGMLQNQQHMPFTEEDYLRLQADGRWDYPLEIPWDGTLVDDPGSDGTQLHPDDIVRRIRKVFDVIWKERAEALEQEACEILGVRDLREYFRKPSLFFADHLKRYSKSRRQAPIYWPLSTASGSYTLWVYYHRLSDGLLYAALNKYVKPKIDDTEKRLGQIEVELPAATGREASKLRDAFEDTKAFLDELREFRAELERVAGLPYKPNLNDGVLITASPLWKLFRLPKWRKDLEECWKKLEGRDYEWAHLAYSIWPDRVREACKDDRSIAIAHRLEELCEVPAKPSGRKRSRKGRKGAEMAEALSDAEG